MSDHRAGGSCRAALTMSPTRRSALAEQMRERFGRVDSGVFPMHRYHYYFRCGNAEEGGA